MFRTSSSKQISSSIVGGESVGQKPKIFFGSGEKGPFYYVLRVQPKILLSIGNFIQLHPFLREILTFREESTYGLHMLYAMNVFSEAQR